MTSILSTDLTDEHHGIRSNSLTEQRRLIRRILASVITAAAFFPAASSAAPIVYSFEQRVQASPGPLSFILPNVGLNAGGTVSLMTNPGPDENAIYTVAPGGSPVELANTAGPFSRFDYIGQINAGGTVAFQATFDGGGEGVYTAAPGGSPIQIARTTSGGFTGFARPSLNASGTVAFIGFGSGNIKGIYTAPAGGAPVQRLNTAGVYANFFFDTPITDAGKVGFVASLDNGAQSLATLQPGGSPVQVASTNGPISNLLNQGPPALTDTGFVAFAAERDIGGEAIYLSVSGGTPTEVVNTNGAFSDFFGVGLNASGLLVFGAILDGENQFRLFVKQPGEPPQQLIGRGDALDGSVVTGVGFGFPLVNDSGQIAFLAGLEDGRQGIYVASPVPEPSGLLVVGALMLMAVRRRRAERFSSVSKVAGAAGGCSPFPLDS